MTTVHLPDGSTATVVDAPNPGCAASIIRRLVAGVVVWEQVLSSWPAEHQARVLHVLAAMAERPGDFTDWEHRGAAPFIQLEMGAA